MKKQEYFYSITLDYHNVGMNIKKKEGRYIPIGLPSYSLITYQDPHHHEIQFHPQTEVHRRRTEDLQIPEAV